MSTESSTPSGSRHRHLAVVAASASAVVEASGFSPAPADEEVDVLQVGELAKLTGKTVRAIHLYESMGLLRPATRSKGGFRLYNADSVERVRWIGKLQAVGFSLPELQEIVRDQESATTALDAAARLRAVYTEKLDDVQAKLRELHRLEHELVASLTYLDACRSACDGVSLIDDCPSCARHIDQPAQPALVAGLHCS